MKKLKYKGGRNVRVEKYEEVIDWQAIGGGVLLVFAIFALLSQCGG
ncbi:hypothetical protein [Henriciella algicola]|nr:hypothetical protein [Henriciella algicola]